MKPLASTRTMTLVHPSESLHIIPNYILQYNLTCTSETCPPHRFHAPSIITRHNFDPNLNSVSPLRQHQHQHPHHPILYLYQIPELIVLYLPLPSPRHLLSAGNHSTSPPPLLLLNLNLVHVPKPLHHPQQG